mmetsp:Transcript_44026/g.72761  ORF Transcript_44026/g.72761 Transcript_44026/m.72761 type:complete len:483 (+) Transcript_44026:950-2398(+)
MICLLLRKNCVHFASSEIVSVRWMTILMAKKFQTPQKSSIAIKFYKPPQFKFVMSKSELYLFGRETKSALLGSQLDETAKLTVPQLVNVCDATITHIACGERYSLAVSDNGDVYEWGLRDKKHATIKSPRQLAGITNAVKVAVGREHSLILAADGAVWTFGKNTFGALGLGVDNKLNVAAPSRVDWLAMAKSPVVKISVGHYHNGVILQNRQIWMWGANSYGQCGFYKHPDFPLPVRADVDLYSSVQCGGWHTLLIRKDGQVVSFGRGTHGQCGRGDLQKRCKLQVIDALSAHTVVAIAAGSLHSLCVTGDGQLFSFGGNEFSELGQCDLKRALRPSKVAHDFEGKVVACAAGLHYSCAITDRNELYMFGQANNGQLGIGLTPAVQKTPTKVKVFGDGSAGIDCVALGRNHSAVIIRSKQENESNDDGKHDGDESNSVVLGLGATKSYQQGLRSQCLAVYIKNQSVFDVDAWVYVAHRRYET